MEARDPLYKVLHGYKLGVPSMPHTVTIIAWCNGFYLLEQGRKERNSMEKVRRILERAKPEIDRGIAEGSEISTDDYLKMAKASFGWVAYSPGNFYPESHTLDIIINTERNILSSNRTLDDANSDGRPKVIKTPVTKSAAKVGGTPAAKAIPKSVLAARAALSQLQKNGDICLANPKAAWPDARIYFGPFDVAVITDADADTFKLVSSVGRVNQTSPLEELFSELPIGPVKFGYQLEPDPMVKHYGQMSLTEASNPEYLLKFIQHHVLCTLVMAIVLVSKDLLVATNWEEFDAFQLNKDQKYFNDVLGYRDLLQRHHKEKIGEVE